MTLLYYDPRFLDHDTGTHPEQPERLRQIMARLESTGLAAQCVRPKWEPASRRGWSESTSRGISIALRRWPARGGGHSIPTRS